MRLSFDRTVAGDETWIPQYDPENKIQSTQWLPKVSNILRNFKAEIISKNYIIATVVSDPEEVIPIEFLNVKR